MIIGDQHIHEWIKTEQRRSNKGTLWRCECGEENWSQRLKGPMYEGPYGWRDRELEALYFTMEGYSSREAAKMMMLNSGSIANYIKHAKTKAGVETTEEVIDLYRRIYNLE